MNELMVELLPEMFELLFFAVGSAALTTAGVLIERYGLDVAATGQTALGVWILLFGLAALYFGLYAMGYRGTVPRLRAVRARLAERR